MKTNQLVFCGLLAAFALRYTSPMTICCFFGMVKSVVLDKQQADMVLYLPGTRRQSHTPWIQCPLWQRRTQVWTSLGQTAPAGTSFPHRCRRPGSSAGENKQDSQDCLTAATKPQTSRLSSENLSFCWNLCNQFKIFQQWVSICVKGGRFCSQAAQII